MKMKIRIIGENAPSQSRTFNILFDLREKTDFSFVAICKEDLLDAKNTEFMVYLPLHEIQSIKNVFSLTVELQ